MTRELAWALADALGQQVLGMAGLIQGRLWDRLLPDNPMR